MDYFSHYMGSIYSNINYSSDMCVSGESWYQARTQFNNPQLVWSLEMVCYTPGLAEVTWKSRDFLSLWSDSITEADTNVKPSSIFLVAYCAHFKV